MWYEHEVQLGSKPPREDPVIVERKPSVEDRQSGTRFCSTTRGAWSGVRRQSYRNL